MNKEICRGEWTYDYDPELDKRVEEEFEEWKKTCDANMDNRMPINLNGCKRGVESPQESKDEREIVHNYAINLIGDNKGIEAWNVYQSVRLAYISYKKKGIPAKSNFDIKELHLQ